MITKPSLRVPDASILAPLLRRAAGLWILVRIAVVGLAAIAPGGDDVALLHWHPPGAIGSIAACALLGFIDTRRRKERALLANLGVADRELVAIFVTPAIFGEIVLAFVLGP